MSEKFIPVELNPRPCPLAKRELHLRKFIDAFILKSRRPRCIHILLESPKKAEDELYRIPNWLDPDYAKLLKGSASFPLPLERALGSARGVYFDDSQSSLLMTAAEAATLAAEDFSEAIFSLEPGKLAVVFSTHHGAYFCKR